MIGQMFTRRSSVLLIAAALPAVGQPVPAKQNPKTARAVNRWTPSRTAWRDVDLQGVWNNSTITELERPRELSGKEVLSGDEAAAVEQRTAQNCVYRPPAAGDPVTYNQFWFDRGTASCRRGGVAGLLRITALPSLQLGIVQPQRVRHGDTRQAPHIGR
jgi:hypothetical protein